MWNVTIKINWLKCKVKCHENLDEDSNSSITCGYNSAENMTRHTIMIQITVKFVTRTTHNYGTDNSEVCHQSKHSSSSDGAAPSPSFFKNAKRGRHFYVTYYVTRLCSCASRGCQSPSTLKRVTIRLCSILKEREKFAKEETLCIVSHSARDVRYLR